MCVLSLSLSVYTPSHTSVCMFAVYALYVVHAVCLYVMYVCMYTVCLYGYAVCGVHKNISFI